MLPMGTSDCAQFSCIPPKLYISFVYFVQFFCIDIHFLLIGLFLVDSFDCVPLTVLRLIHFVCYLLFLFFL